MITRYNFFIAMLLLTFNNCIDEPVKEDVPELVTKVTLTFSPVGGGSNIMISATDPDGEGIQSIEADGAIVLAQNTAYTLSLALINELADPTSPEYNISSEVEEEGNEHLFFFAWTNDLFETPSGNGNIDARTDAVDYQDSDGVSPIGITTQWTTTLNATTGTFRILLKHQPGVKSTTSTSADGETDLDLTFNLQIQ
jgi:hypothetical protein